MDTTRRTAAARMFAGDTLAVRLRYGRSAMIRLAEPEDAGYVTTMHSRCSTETIFQRYHSVPSMTGRFLTSILNTDIALVARLANQSVIAMANLGRDDDGSGELAVIVEDSRHGFGLGTELLRTLVTMARLTGYREVHAACLTSDGWARRSLERIGSVQAEYRGDHTKLRLPLRAQRLSDRRTVPDLVPTP